MQNEFLESSSNALVFHGVSIYFLWCLYITTSVQKSKLIRLSKKITIFLCCFPQTVTSPIAFPTVTSVPTITSLRTITGHIHHSGWIGKDPIIVVVIIFVVAVFVHQTLSVSCFCVRLLGCFGRTASTTMHRRTTESTGRFVLIVDRTARTVAPVRFGEHAKEALQKKVQHLNVAVAFHGLATRIATRTGMGIDPGVG